MNRIEAEKRASELAYEEDRFMGVIHDAAHGWRVVDWEDEGELSRSTVDPIKVGGDGVQPGYDDEEPCNERITQPII